MNSNSELLVAHIFKAYQQQKHAGTRYRKKSEILDSKKLTSNVASIPSLSSIPALETLGFVNKLRYRLAIHFIQKANRKFIILANFLCHLGQGCLCKTKSHMVVTLEHDMPTNTSKKPFQNTLKVSPKQSKVPPREQIDIRIRRNTIEASSRQRSLIVVQDQHCRAFCLIQKKNKRKPMSDVVYEVLL